MNVISFPLFCSFEILIFSICVSIFATTLYFTAVAVRLFDFFFKHTGLDDDVYVAADFFFVCICIYICMLRWWIKQKRNHKWLDSTLWKSVDLWIYIWIGFLLPQINLLLLLYISFGSGREGGKKWIKTLTHTPLLLRLFFFSLMKIIFSILSEQFYWNVKCIVLFISLLFWIATDLLISLDSNNCIHVFTLSTHILHSEFHVTIMYKCTSLCPQLSIFVTLHTMWFGTLRFDLISRASTCTLYNGMWIFFFFSFHKTLQTYERFIFTQKFC